MKRIIALAALGFIGYKLLKNRSIYTPPKNDSGQASTDFSTLITTPISGTTKFYGRQPKRYNSI